MWTRHQISLRSFVTFSGYPLHFSLRAPFNLALSPFFMSPNGSRSVDTQIFFCKKKNFTTSSNTFTGSFALCYHPRSSPAVSTNSFLFARYDRIVCLFSVSLHSLPVMLRSIAPVFDPANLRKRHQQHSDVGISLVLSVVFLFVKKKKLRGRCLSLAKDHTSPPHQDDSRRLIHRLSHSRTQILPAPRSVLPHPNSTRVQSLLNCRSQCLIITFKVCFTQVSHVRNTSLLLHTRRLRRKRA